MIILSNKTSTFYIGCNGVKLEQKKERHWLLSQESTRHLGQLFRQYNSVRVSRIKLTKITNHAKKVFLVNRCSHMPRIVSVPLSLEQRERLIFLAKHAKHWRERQRAQTILWLSEGKSVAEVATLQERIPETIRLQRRRWELYEFESIKEGHRSGRPNTLISDYQAKILDWVNTSPLNAEQIRVKLHEEYEVSVSVETIRKFLRDSGMVFKRTRHSLKKKRSDCI